MFSTALLFRIAKSISVFAIGLMAFIIVIGNVTDYYTNYFFVEHVMKMDTIFPDSHILYRHVNNSFLFHAGYILIIVLEAFMSFCCLKGSWLLFKNISSDSLSFQSFKNWSVAGITVGIVVWFFGFEVIGGEWFAMWQSATWNGLASAERIVSFLVLTLIFLQGKDETLSSA